MVKNDDEVSPLFHVFSAETVRGKCRTDVVHGAMSALAMEPLQTTLIRPDALLEPLATTTWTKSLLTPHRIQPKIWVTMCET